MRDLFATLPDDPAPPTAPDYLDTVLARGRRSARRHRAAAVAAWVGILLAVAALAVPDVRFTAGPAAPAATPGLPDHFAGYSVRTAGVHQAPAGRAIALYTYGSGEAFNMFQPLVVGADGDTYRRVDAVADRNLASALLAPDGTRVLVGDDRGATDTLLLVDLRTGRQLPIPLGAPVGVRLLAWSPDGRYVAYATAPYAPADPNEAGVVDSEVSQAGTLRILDVDTGRSTAVPALKPAWAATFAPDSRGLAVQVGHTVHLIDVAGRESRTVPLPAGQELVGNVGWSPDGALLATMTWQNEADTGHGEFLTTTNTIGFLRLTGAPAPPSTTGAQLLGWRTADTVLVATVDDAGFVGIAEVALPSGASRPLARFDTGSTCELHTQPCAVTDLQLASGLVPTLTVRHAGSAARGPWPTWLTATIAVTILATAGVAWLIRRRRLRRSRRSVKATPTVGPDHSAQPDAT